MPSLTVMIGAAFFIIALAPMHLVAAHTSRKWVRTLFWRSMLSPDPNQFADRPPSRSTIPSIHNSISEPGDVLSKV